MDITGKQAICFLILMAILYEQVTSDCGGTCYSGPVWPEPDHTFRRKHLRGFSYKNFTTDLKRCYSSCSQDCRCKACQMSDQRCELLDEDKTSMPRHFLDAPDYVYYDIEQDIVNKTSHLLPPNTCYNGCCQNELCMNGGTCTERCQSPREKFICTCSKGYFGKLCETKIRTCMDILVASKSTAKDGVYWLWRSDKEKIIPVYCSFEQQTNRAWTLIESFSFKDNPFKNLPFSKDQERNSENPPSWSVYRMGLRRMKYFRENSTLFRATCNFPDRIGSLRPDYLLGSLNDLDLLEEVNVWKCKKYLEIDIRGRHCTQCLAHTIHQAHFHIHINTEEGRYCQRPHFPVSADGQKEDSFGYYKDHNKQFQCTATDGSTTQWWFGETR